MFDWNVPRIGRKHQKQGADAKMQLDVLLSELKSREDFIQNQIKNEASNFLAVLGSVGAAGTIYTSQLLRAQASGQDIPAALILGLAVVFLWFPMNQAWHMTELRAAEKYVEVIADEVRRVIPPEDGSKMLTWTTFRLEEITPSWRRWYISTAMVARGGLLYVPSLSLAGYCLWGLTGQGTFNVNDALQWTLLLTAALGVLFSATALIAPYWKLKFRRELREGLPAKDGRVPD